MMTWEGGRQGTKYPELAGSIPDLCRGWRRWESEHGGCVYPGICERGGGSRDTF